MMIDKAFFGRFKAVTECYVDPNNKELMESFEMSQFKQKSFKKKFDENCLGKQQCSLDLLFSDFAQKKPENQKLNMVLFAQA